MAVFGNMMPILSLSTVINISTKEPGRRMPLFFISKVIGIKGLLTSVVLPYDKRLPDKSLNE